MAFLHAAKDTPAIGRIDALNDEKEHSSGGVQVGRRNPPEGTRMRSSEDMDIRFLPKTRTTSLPDEWRRGTRKGRGAPAL